MTNSIVLLSGGLDSAVALFWARDKGYDLRALAFNYFLRSKREISACKKIASFAGVQNSVVDLNFLREVEDSKTHTTNPILKRAPSAYIPSRNVIFYGIASSFAETLDAKFIIGGHNRNDVKSFPDSSPRFFKKFNSTASFGKISGNRTGQVILPLSGLDKSQVVKLGINLGVPFELTWSCYTSNPKPCGKCHSCELRREAFGKAKESDPLMVAP
ncbi:MAG: 7-cyano-7-deazaguanine synthase QueC [Nitrososphaerota archaeon]|nr:7-cyano-7-deazaguanine synthase QueC [Nitrososphaerota archaeon]MDG6922945.1 7-cyano-7-deazaguanine synthase QueC [Nitrososphaerota archaeon]